jgi:IclR family transcriptional regulator, acetate operon repressor
MRISRGSLERGLDILALLASSEEPVHASDLASKLHLPRSTVYRLLHTLRKRALVTPTTMPGSVTLGVVFLRWAAVVRARLKVIDLAGSHLEVLSRMIGETANLHLLEGDHAVPVDQRVTSARLRVVTEMGVPIPLHAGAVGKVMLAFLPHGDQVRVARQPLSVIGPRTITDPRRLLRELALIRHRGYAESDEEVLKGARGLAAPIFDAGGAVVASIGIGGPRDRFRGTTVRNALCSLRGAAAEISGALGSIGGHRSEAQEDMTQPESRVRWTRTVRARGVASHTRRTRL